MSLQDLCNPEVASCAAPFQTTYRDKLWVGATNKHGMLLLPHAGGHYPGPAFDTVEVMTPGGPPHQNTAVRDYGIRAWAADSNIPKIAVMAGRTVDRTLVHKFLCEAPSTNPDCLIHINSYGTRDAIHLSEMTGAWKMLIAPYTWPEGEADGLGPELIAYVRMLAKCAQPVAMPLPVPAQIAKKLPAQTIRKPSKHEQALAQLQGPWGRRDKAGVMLDKWGAPIQARYR